MKEDIGLGKVTVIIPTYNRGNMITRSIQSVLQQTYKEIELIVVDDGSTDNTEQVVRDIKDERLRYIKMEKNCGPSAARNMGICCAQGQYIAFQDSDDYWYPKKLQIQLAEIERDKNCQMVFCAYINKGKGDDFKIPREDYFEVSGCEHGMLDHFLISNKAGTPSMLIKSDFIRTSGVFNEELFSLEDWEFALRIVDKGKVCFINQALFESNYSPEGVNSVSGYAKADAQIYILSIYWKKYRNKSIFHNIIYNILEEIHFMTPDEIEDCLKRIGIITECEDLCELIFSKEKTIINLEHASRLTRYKYEVLKKLLDSSISGSLEKWLKEKNIRSAAVYGIGDVGKYLIKLLKAADISVRYTIDKKPEEIDGIPSYPAERIRQTADGIIITASDPERTIEKKLQQYTENEIYYIEDII